MWVVGVVCCLWSCAAAQMRVVSSWTNVDFTFPSESNRAAMIRKGLFIPANIALIDVDVSNGEAGTRMFVTMPRFKPGTPATLATVSPNGLLAPYPEWSWHREGHCDGITSVFRVQIDECDRLWVLDSGKVDIFTGKPRQICKPQILLFNLKNDQLIGRYRFPDGVVDNNSLLVTIAVDTRGNKCQDTFAYIADVVSFKLIVFDANRERSWRIASNYFYPYPLHGGFDISGVHFDLMDGILGLAIGPLAGGDRTLYWHSLASVRESWVQTSVLRNESVFTQGDSSPRSFMVSRGTRPSQSAAQTMSPSGVLYFGLLSNNSIACWNSRLPFSQENIITIAQDQNSLQFASGVKLVGDRVYVLTSRLQNYIVGKVPEGETNYRVVELDPGRLPGGPACSSAPARPGFNPDYKPFVFTKQ